MEVFEGVDAYDSEGSPSVLSIGILTAFISLIERSADFIKEEAARRGGRSVILTFEPHPALRGRPRKDAPL